MPLTVPVKIRAVDAAPLHTGWFATVFTEGVGLTMILKLLLAPVQLLALGVTVTIAVSGITVVLTAVKDAILLVPVDARPMADRLLLQL